MLNTVDRWLVARTKTGQEQRAVVNVERQGYEYYLPQIRTFKGKVECLFPGYLFVRVGLRWYSLRSTYGILNVIMSGSQREPAIMPDVEIEAIRQRENEAGLVILEEQQQQLRRGDRVRVTEGPLDCQTGIYAGALPHDRVRVLFDLLGRKTTVVLSASQVEREG